MIRYIPFLKLKSNEIIALGDLAPEVLEEITPFFDFPRKQGSQTAEEFQASVDRSVKALGRHLGELKESYFDTYDLSEDHKIGAVHKYYYALQSLEKFCPIPVVSLDRSVEHLDAVSALVADGVVSSSVVAFRITSEDFEDFDVVAEDIESALGHIFTAFEKIDLIFDCRVCRNANCDKVSRRIQGFAHQFASIYPVRRFVVTGSSVPASIGDTLKVDTECFVDRAELAIFKNIKKQGDLRFIFGDYTVISPEYSDVTLAPEIMQSVMTAKLIYSLGEQHYFIRGSSLKTGGYEQYFDLASKLCGKGFFRGKNYSAGDKYFTQKGLLKGASRGNNCTPASVVKPSVNAHITYTVMDLLA